MAAGTFESILSDIRSRKFAPVYFFCGEEPYFIDELAGLIEQLGLSDAEKAFNQSILYGKDINARQILETCGRLPMMAERQVVIIREAQALSLKEDEEKQYLAYLKNPVKSTVLVFAWKHDKPDGRKAFSREIKKSSVYFEPKLLYENQVAPWVKSWLQHRKYKIEDRAAALLAEYTGADLAKVVNELEKLIISKQPGANITVDDIEREVGISKEYNVFELSNAMGHKNKSKAYQIANYFVSNPKNGPLVMILGTLHGFFSKIYLCQQMKHADDKELASSLKVNPYFIKDYKNAARNYSEKQLENIFYILEEYDLRSKGVNSTNNIKEGELLKEMVYRIMS